MDREIKLEVKKTRIGKLLTFVDSDAPDGVRAMTEAEVKLHDYIENLTRKFDTESVEPGKVGVVSVSDTGEPKVDWCTESAAEAANT